MSKVNINWELVVKLKKLKNTSININEEQLVKVLKVKEYNFNNHIPTSKDDILDHPMMIDKYFKKL